ncbi:hypothetical protein BHM03_00027322 [Ensete ventricosum]|nr:hypothetical protein BHM03_00027322 [Ensete ventricosum]
MRRRGCQPPMEGWPPTARQATAEAPLQGGGQLRPAAARPPARGGHPQGQQPASGQPTAYATLAGRPPVGRSTTRCQRPARKGLLVHSEAVGAAPAGGQGQPSPAQGQRRQWRRREIWG